MAIGANMTKREQMWGGIGIAAVLILGAYWYFLYKPKSAELAVTQAHVVSLEKKNQHAKADIATGSLQKLRAQSAEYEQSLKVMRQLVPRSNEVPALLEDISTAARRVGLDLATVEPMPVLPGEQFEIRPGAARFDDVVLLVGADHQGDVDHGGDAKTDEPGVVIEKAQRGDEEADQGDDDAGRQSDQGT